MGSTTKEKRELRTQKGKLRKNRKKESNTSSFMLISLRRSLHPIDFQQLYNVKEESAAVVNTRVEELTEERTFSPNCGSSPAEIHFSFLYFFLLYYKKYNMKSNRTLRHVKSIRPAAHLVNWESNTADSLSSSIIKSILFCCFHLSIQPLP